MRNTDDEMAKIHSQMQEAGRVSEMLASYVEGFELSDALKCLLDNKVDNVGLVAVNISRVLNSGDGWWNISCEVHPVRVLSDMILRVIASREANIRRRKEPAIRGMVFYAASPFKIEGLGYMPVRTAIVCRLDSGDELMLRLSVALRL